MAGVADALPSGPAKADMALQLGDAELLLPVLIRRGLSANDRANYYLALLQEARARADDPGRPIRPLRDERLAAGITDASLDVVVERAEAAGPGTYLIPGAGRIHADLVAAVEEMLAPLPAGGPAGPDHRGLPGWPATGHRRPGVRLGLLPPAAADLRPSGCRLPRGGTGRGRRRGDGPPPRRAARRDGRGRPQGAGRAAAPSVPRSRRLAVPRRPPGPAGRRGGGGPLGPAVSAGVGLAGGLVALDGPTARVLASSGSDVILVTEHADTGDVAALESCQGLLTGTGARTSHAAVVARQLGVLCLVGCRDLRIGGARRSLRLGDRTVAEGDPLTLDGNTGEVYPGILGEVEERPEGLLDQVRRWQLAPAG